MGAAPPWGQSLLRSCLAAHSFPPPPPLIGGDGCPYPEIAWPIGFVTGTVNVTDGAPEKGGGRGDGQCQGQTRRERGVPWHAQPLGGWGREGVRSEARAQQRLA